MGTHGKINNRGKGVNNRESSALSKLLSGEGTGNGSVADWASVPADIIVRLICAIGAVSGAVRFGYSRDGGAYALGIYLADDSETLYFKPYDDVGAKLEELTDKIQHLM